MPKLFNEVLGKEVTLPESPERIVSFSPAATETLFQLGLGERVAGVSAFCARPAEAKAKRRVGSYSTVRPEILEEVRADLIITVTGYQREFAVRLSERFPVYPLELPVSVAGIVDFVVKVGLVAGAPGRGRELGGELLKAAARPRGGIGLRGYVEADLGGPVSFGRHSYITDAFALLGCGHVYDGKPAEWLEPDIGEVASEDPDFILYEPKMLSGFREEDVKQVLTSRGWEGLRAARLGNVFVTPGPLDFIAHHGPSFITEVLPWLEGKLGAAKMRVDT